MNSKVLKKEKMINETRLLTYLFFKIYNLDLKILNYQSDILLDAGCDGSDTGLSKITGISSSTVGRRLTNKELIKDAFPSNYELIYESIINQRKINLKSGKKYGLQKANLNNYANENKKYDLSFFCQNLDEEYDLLFQIALTFRANLKTLVSLFPKYLEEDIMKRSTANEYHSSLDYLFTFDNYNQSIASSFINTFYNELLNNKTNYKIIKDKYLQDKCFIDNSFENILDYQLKYAISSQEIIKEFNLDKKEYDSYIISVLKNNLFLKNRFANLAKYKKKK